MFLSIDAGNSNIVFGFYEIGSRLWKYEHRINTRSELPLLQVENELHLFLLEKEIKPASITEIGLSSVVPDLNATLLKFCIHYLNKPCYLISGKSYEKLQVSTTRPSEIGTDLMCNATAAFYRFHKACIVVDFGTALTFTVVSDEGKILGVNIVPGLNTAIKSLFLNTAKLPEVKLEMPISAIGKNTIHSIQAGVLYGYTGLVKGMLETIQNELGYSCKIVATGGLSAILTTLKNNFEEVDRNLTLEGIRLITEANV